MISIIVLFVRNCLLGNAGQFLSPIVFHNVLCDARATCFAARKAKRFNIYSV